MVRLWLRYILLFGLAAMLLIAAVWLITDKTPGELARAVTWRVTYYAERRPLPPARMGDGGPATRLRLYNPMGITWGPAGQLFFSDRGRDLRGRVIWKVDELGIAHVVAGTGRPGNAVPGQPALEADLAQPEGIAFGPDDRLHFVDAHDHRVFRLEPDGSLAVVAGTGEPGDGGDGGPATEATLHFPADIRFDDSGNLYITDVYNHRIRRVSARGEIETVAGTGTRGFSGDGGLAVDARLDHPWGMFVDPETGDLIVGDSENHRIRRVGADGSVRTIAGTGSPGYSGDGGPAIQARLDSPQSFAVGCDGSLYVGDEHNHAVRRIDPDGRIETVMGTGLPGLAADGAPARGAPLNDPENLLVTCDGTLYVTDGDNRRVLRVTPEGLVENVAGRPAPGPHGPRRLLSRFLGGGSREH